MMFVSHSVFKDQKNHQHCGLKQQASLLERRVTYAICTDGSTAFFKLFFRTISCSNSANFAARFVVNKAGDSTHKKKPRNFFLPFFSPPQKQPKNPYFQAIRKTNPKTPQKR